MDPDQYYVYVDGKFQLYSLGILAKRMEISPQTRISTYGGEGKHPDLWSARLSTGLFGLPNCVPGNRGPKGHSEVILAVGDEGLSKLVDQGFITCPSCHPEDGDTWFWHVIKKPVRTRYGITRLEDFTDKNILPFDARRIDWEEILPVTRQAPNRLYLPEGVPADELIALRERFAELGHVLPHVGYWNHKAQENTDPFVEYVIPQA
jgi:hypothetical protein